MLQCVLQCAVALLTSIGHLPRDGRQGEACALQCVLQYVLQRVLQCVLQHLICIVHSRSENVCLAAHVLCCSVLCDVCCRVCCSDAMRIAEGY